MRILYMGTPDFAVYPLKLLIEAGHDVVAVVTQPDKLQGRHMVLTPPPVKVCALENEIEVYQPDTLKNEAFKETLEKVAPELIVVVAYGKILPEYILSYPKYGCINLHGSLLPQYRGAAPMQRAIMEGQSTIGATIMYMEKGLDTGDMLSKCSFPLTDDMNFENVHDLLSIKGSELLIDTIAKLEKGEIIPEKQDDSISTYAAKIEKQDMVIDFTNSARQVHNHIRGLSPVPLTFATVNGKKIKFVESFIINENKNVGLPGEVIKADSKGFEIACGTGSVLITTVVPEGKKKMPAASFVNGRGLAVGDVFN